MPDTNAWRKAATALIVLVLHAASLSLLYTGVRRRDWIAFGILYVVVLFSLGNGLHRYFAHRAFKTGRAFQFLLGLLCTSFFGDPIGFSGRHRLHHRHSDTERDIHDLRRGLWYTWFGRLLEDGYFEDEILEATRDLTRYPELLWLHRYYPVIGFAAAGAVYAIGGYTMFAAGYCLTVCLIAVHGASAVNFFGHQAANRRFHTNDRSSNNAWLALLMFGEGWHNNHHAFPAAARSGFLWYEIDLLYYMLRALAWLGLVWDLRDAPAAARRPWSEALRTTSP
jgi:stearoyl-CoA desaturase (Delta-9 desaturase)